jgi:hypothetical protein
MNELTSRIGLLIVTLIGLASSTGYLLNITELKMIGQMTGSSPSPLVFNQFNGLEYWASKGTVVLTQKDGRSTSLPVDHTFYQAVRGPHLRKIAAIIPLSLAPVLNEGHLNQNLQALFCRGLLNAELGIQGDVDSVALFVESPTRGREFTWRNHYVCR